MPAMDNAHALIVGIADYQHIRKLPQVKDAEDIAGLLTDPTHCGYPQGNVELLLDGQASRDAIRQGLGKLVQRGDQNATVFLYFSGHGGRLESGPHSGQYLLPVDTRYPDDQALAQTAISGSEFTAALNSIPARKVVVVFDCCHSGGIGRPRDATAPELKAGLAAGYYEALAAGQGRVILASSRTTEYSYVLAGADYGLFTQHLLAGLRGGVPSDDGLIRIFDLFEYLQPRVTHDHPQQHPLFKAEVEENFPVALYLGGRKGVVPKDDEGFRFDAYVSYVDRGPDATWVWQTLVPRLEAAGLRVAVSGDVEEPGVARVVNVERGIRHAKRTVVVLSEAYLADRMAGFENVLGQTMGVQEGTYRLLPVKIGPMEEGRIPLRLSQLTTLDLAHPHRAEREFGRLVKALQGPLPRA
jgi:hypothetical protein